MNWFTKGMIISQVHEPRMFCIIIDKVLSLVKNIWDT